MFLSYCIVVTTVQVQHRDRGKAIVEQTVLESIRDRSVKVVCGDYQGSGVILASTDEQIVIVSAAHILMFDVEAEVVFADLSTTTGYVAGISSQSDIGFLIVKYNELTEQQKIFTQMIQTDCTILYDYTEGDEVVLSASNEKPGETMLTGTILNENVFVPDVNENVIMTDIIITAGMSGAGLFLNSGSLIGIVIAGNQENSLVIPIATVLSQQENLLQNRS